LLTGSISRLAKPAAGRPPSASPRWWTMQSRRAVRRADGAITPSSKRSANICLPHRTASHRNRRAMITSWALLPARGRSLTRRRYRLRTRRDAAPHDGHTPKLFVARTVITVLLSSQIALSITNPTGTRQERRNSWAIALIPSPGMQRQHHRTASKLSQSQNCMPINTQQQIRVRGLVAARKINCELLAPNRWKLEGKQSIFGHGGCGGGPTHVAIRVNNDLLRESLVSCQSCLYNSSSSCIIRTRRS
jgi:hypothetical protein